MYRLTETTEDGLLIALAGKLGTGPEQDSTKRVDYQKKSSQLSASRAGRVTGHVRERPMMIVNL